MSGLTTGVAARLLDLDAAAGMLGISPHTLRRYAQQGKLPVTRLGALLQFDRAHLEQFIQANTRPWAPSKTLSANARKGHQGGRLKRKAA